MTDAEYYRKYNQTIRGKSKRLHLNKQLYCRKQHIKYDLNADWIEERIRRGCELTGLSFKIKTSGVFHPLGPSIDRIDPQLGYTKENCRLILHALNNMKSWADDDLMYFIADALIKAKGKKTKPIKYDAKENKFQKEKKLVLIKDGDMTQIFTKRQKEIE